MVEIRGVLLLEMLVLLAVGLYHRIRSLQSKEALDRTQEGWGILIGLRLTGLLVIAANVAWIRDAHALDWAAIAAPLWLRWVGTAGFAVSVAWLWWMFHSLGRNLTDTVVTRATAQFVCHGPYRYVRNPMYVGVFFAGISLGLAEGNWLVPLGACVVFAFMAVRTSIEEKFLIARFGEQYRDYMRRVGRFWPLFS